MVKGGSEVDAVVPAPVIMAGGVVVVVVAIVVVDVTAVLASASACWNAARVAGGRSDAGIEQDAIDVERTRLPEQDRRQVAEAAASTTSSRTPSAARATSHGASRPGADARLVAAAPGASSISGW